MESLIKLLNGWEIQLLVLFSFTIQFFLFFVGNQRLRWSNMFLRFSIWLAYLGADLVAIYALGYLSRHVDATTGGETLRGAHPLAFFWAPFLLVHLGGQDTITAFSMEDNNLWLRHLLNMVVQVVLAIYIFWKSIGSHSIHLLISGIFVFVAGVIKYGERIWSLRCGSLESLESSTGDQYKYALQEYTADLGFSRTVYTGLHLMPKVLEVLTGRSFEVFNEYVREFELLELVGLELGILHNDLYTKAIVLRTRSGIILRCISQITMVVALVMFLTADNKQSYSRVDIAVTYLLFVGVFFLEFCAVFITLMSPWTWVWLKARGCNCLARFSWFLLSNGAMGRTKKRPLWSNVIGQYNLRGWLMHSVQPSYLFSRYVMIMVTKLSTIFGIQVEKIFWFSKLLGREYTDGDTLLKCLEHKIMLHSFSNQVGPGTMWRDQLHSIFTEESDRNDFGNLLIVMHVSTEVYLSRYHSSNVADGTDVSVANSDVSDGLDVLEANWNVAYGTDVSLVVYRQLSRYMMYLLVTHPSLLPLDKSAAATLEWWRAAVSEDGFMAKLESIHELQTGVEDLKQLEDSWMWVIMYAAAKSRPEMHAALLARGGEPLTFLWLLLAHLRFGSMTRSGLYWYRTIDRNNDYINEGIPQSPPQQRWPWTQI